MFGRLALFRAYHSRLTFAPNICAEHHTRLTF